MHKDFKNKVKELNISLSDLQLQQFEDYFLMLVDWNQRMNLTAITEKDDVYLKHFYDSLSITKTLDLNNQSLLDVGSGAGFPSIPLKIVFPNLQITIIDSLQKRITFLAELTKKLGIEANLIHGRAEDYETRESFDIVTARAVANLPLLAELCIPLVKLNGHFIAMKGSKYQEELELANNATKTLGTKLESVITYEIDGIEFGLLTYVKHKKTPSIYPRHYSKMKSNPL